MNLRELQRQAGTLWTLFTSRTPVYLILYLTSRCNFRCPMCFYLEEIRDPDKDEIDLCELEKLSRSMGRLVQLSLTGGEPFLRRDIPEVVAMFARNNAARYVTIPTNGFLTDRILTTLERLVADQPDVHFRIPVSLDGYPDDHDRIRSAGSFAGAAATLDALVGLRRRVHNLSVDVNTCYSALNEDRLAGFVDFVADRFDVDNHTVTYVRGNAEAEARNPSIREYARIVDDIRRRRGPRESRPFSSLLRGVMDYQRDVLRRTLENDRMYVPCVAGRKMIVVSERGHVLPCEILDRPLGSLEAHDHDVRSVLGTPQAREVTRWIRQTKCHCTFECALVTSIIFDWRSYPAVFWRAVRSRIGRRSAVGEPRTRNSAAFGQTHDGCCTEPSNTC